MSTFYQSLKMFYAGKKEAGQKSNTLTNYLQRDQVNIRQMERKHLKLLDIILNSILLHFQVTYMKTLDYLFITSVDLRHFSKK